MTRHETCDFDFHRANRWPAYDHHGIFYTYVCPKCEREKISPAQRAHLATYEADEPIDEDGHDPR